MTRHAYLDAWKAGSGLCFIAKRLDLTEVPPGARFVGQVYVCGEGDLCGHCRRALAAQADDIRTFLSEDRTKGNLNVFHVRGITARRSCCPTG